ncbi:MAG TPA: SH3 domain-containing protein [Spirillospora sp.]|nr:SH3 domain-containing protein [Spirillospora sp.]
MRYLTIALLTLGSLTVPLAAQESNVTASVYQTVNVRSGPSTQFDIVGKLEDGDTVPVLGRDSDATRWLYVALPDGTEGWVAVFTVTLSGSVDSLAIIHPTPPNADSSADLTPAPDGVSIVAFGRVNVRSGPGINYDIVGQLDVEDRAMVTARSNYNNDWLYIENDELAGWVAYFTVTVRGNPDELPVLVPDPAGEELVPPSALIETSFNLRLHDRPAFSAPVTAELPYGTEVIPLGVTRDGRWLFVAAEEATGWGWTRLFNITAEQLAQVPRLNPMTTPTPTPTATPTR